MTVAATFRDPALEAEYREQGFAVTALLDADEIEQVRAGYRALVPPGDHGLTIDYMRPDRTAMHEIAALLEPVWARHFPELFTDHRPVLTSFITKHPGPASNMFLHDDRTLVDETRFRSGTLWIPLVDTGPHLDNGGLQLIPKSHRLNDVLAGTDTPELYRPYEAYLHDRLRSIPVPAGHALYYDTRTLHASPPNLTSEPREAIGCAVAPREADLIHVLATSRRHRRVYRIDETFFLEVHPHEVDRHIDGRWPMIAELDDDSRLDADAVVALLGPSDGPEEGPRRPVSTPPGVHASARRIPLIDEDPPFRAADLVVEGEGAPIPRVEPVYGTVGALDLRTEADGDPWLRPVRPLAADRPLATMIAVDPRSRTHIHLDPPATRRGRSRAEPWTLDVVDASTGKVDLAVDDVEMLLDESMSLDVDPRVPRLTVTNRGAGVLVLLVTRSVVPPPHVTGRSVGARMGSLRRLARTRLTGSGR